MRLAALHFILIGTLAATQAAEVAPTRQGNVWGINYAFDPGGSTVATTRMLGLARTLVGDWGYLRHGLSIGPDIAATKRGMAMIRAHHLIPVVGGAAPDPQFREPGKHYPRTDADGSMRTAARAKAAIWRRLYEAGIPFYAVEVMNEVNIDDKWPAEKYAQWLYDYAVEVKAAYPGLKVCSCGMAGSGADYYDRMLAYRPELKQAIDFWGVHPYAANNPPEVEPTETTLRSYELTARVLDKHGVKPIRLMCTETGYELEIGSIGKNPAYPAINEDNRAEYMTRAFRDYYVPDARIEMVSPFLLWDLSWHGWDGWSYMGNDGRPKPIYLKSAAEPKRGGKDWLPTGDAAIEGRITWESGDIGIPRVVVYTEPGLYGAVTDDAGYYRIEGVPDGAYVVQAFADGYQDARSLKIVASRKRPAKYDASLVRASLVAPAFAPDGDAKSPLRLQGWEVLTKRTGELCSVDASMRDPGRKPTLRFDIAEPGEAGVYRYGGYHSAYPGEVYLTDVLVRSTRLQADAESDGGPWLELAIANGRGELLSTSRVVAPKSAADGKWHRLTAACFAPARGSRVRVTLGVSHATGEFWFSEPFVGEADVPLPADASFKTTGYVPPLYEQNRKLFAQTAADIKTRNPSLASGLVVGKVVDFRGRAVPRAVVATDSPVFVTVADDQGVFSLTVPAEVQVHVRAFAGALDPFVSRPLSVAAGETVSLDVRCPAPPAPDALLNGGFNRFTKGNAGQVHGWTTFGSTDGCVASGKTIFEVPSFEGEGLYLAQAGSNVKNGGACQIVRAIPGRKYRLSAHVYTRTEDPGQRPLDNNCRIGIDPTGGRDPDSKDVVWTEPPQSERKWTRIAVEATARTERITVFIRHEMRRANTWNLTLFDAVRLEPRDEQKTQGVETHAAP
jgi:hypothetical protein